MRLHILTAVSLLWSLSLGVSASEVGQKKSLYFAGAAILGAASESETRFPRISKLIAEKEPNGQGVLDKRLLEKALTQPSINILTDLGNASGIDATAVALVFTWENTSVQKLTVANTIALDIQAQVLLFDFASKKVIGAYPFAVQLLDAKDSSPTDDELTQKFSALLYGPGGVVDQFSQVLSGIELGHKSEGVFLKIDFAPIKPEAEASLKKIEIDAALAQDVIGFSFERFLSKNAQVPVVPYFKDQVVGSKMAARFSNAAVFDFVLPEPDFVFRLGLQDYKSIVLAESSSTRSIGFATYLDVTLLQPLSGKVYFSGTYRLPVTATFPKSVSEIDQRKWFYESVFALSDQLTKSLSRDDKGWLNEWAQKKPNKQEVAEVRRVLEKARH